MLKFLINNFCEVLLGITFLLINVACIYFITMFSLIEYNYKNAVENIDTTYSQIIKSIETNANKYDKDTYLAKLKELKYENYKASFDQWVIYKEHNEVITKQLFYYLVILLVLIIMDVIFSVF